jgi:hypothetical protein
LGKPEVFGIYSAYPKQTYSIKKSNDSSGEGIIFRQGIQGPGVDPVLEFFLPSVAGNDNIPTLG